MSKQVDIPTRNVQSNEPSPGDVTIVPLPKADELYGRDVVTEAHQLALNMTRSTGLGAKMSVKDQAPPEDKSSDNEINGVANTLEGVGGGLGGGMTVLLTPKFYKFVSKKLAMIRHAKQLKNAVSQMTEDSAELREQIREAMRQTAADSAGDIRGYYSGDVDPQTAQLWTPLDRPDTSGLLEGGYYSTDVDARISQINRINDSITTDEFLQRTRTTMADIMAQSDTTALNYSIEFAQMFTGKLRSTALDVWKRNPAIRQRFYKNTALAGEGTLQLSEDVRAWTGFDVDDLVPVIPGPNSIARTIRWGNTFKSLYNWHGKLKSHGIDVTFGQGEKLAKIIEKKYGGVYRDAAELYNETFSVSDYETARGNLSDAMRSAAAWRARAAQTPGGQKLFADWFNLSNWTGDDSIGSVRNVPELPTTSTGNVIRTNQFPPPPEFSGMYDPLAAPGMTAYDYFGEDEFYEADEDLFYDPDEDLGALLDQDVETVEGNTVFEEGETLPVSGPTPESALSDLVEGHVNNNNDVDLVRNWHTEELPLKNYPDEIPTKVSAAGMSGALTSAARGLAHGGVLMATDRLASEVKPDATEVEHDAISGGIATGIVAAGTAVGSVLVGSTVATAAAAAIPEAAPLLPAVLAAGATHRAVADAIQKSGLSKTDSSALAQPVAGAVGGAVGGVTAVAAGAAVAAGSALLAGESVALATAPLLAAGPIGWAVVGGVVAGATLGTVTAAITEAMVAEEEGDYLGERITEDIKNKTAWARAHPAEATHNAYLYNFGVDVPTTGNFESDSAAYHKAMQMKYGKGWRTMDVPTELQTFQATHQLKFGRLIDTTPKDNTPVIHLPIFDDINDEVRFYQAHPLYRDDKHIVHDSTHMPMFNSINDEINWWQGHQEYANLGF